MQASDLVRLPFQKYVLIDHSRQFDFSADQLKSLVVAALDLTNPLQGTESELIAEGLGAARVFYVFVEDRIDSPPQP